MATPAQIEAQNKARLANDPNAYLAAGGALSNGSIPLQIAPNNQQNIQLSPSMAIPDWAGTNINSSTVASSTTAPFQTPETPVTPSITTPPALTMTPEEQKAQSTSDRLQELENILAGKSTYEAQQKELFKVTEKQGITTSLVNQINALAEQSKAVPLQLEKGAGGIVTRDILGRQQREILAQNSEKALILNAQYNTAVGDLAMAQQNVQDAVNAKFAGYEAEKNAKLANLKYIQESPAYTLAEKNRAAAQTAAITAQADEKQKVKDATAAVAKLAADAAAATGVDSLTLKNLQEFVTQINAKTTTAEEAQTILTKAQALAAPFLKDTKAPGVIGSAETGYMQWNPKTGKYDIQVTAPKGKTIESLSILDVARYNELYPDAGVVAGDTEATANAKIAAINTPEAKTRSLIVSAKDNGNDYNTVIKEIESDTTIKDKVLAKKIADEVYGKTVTIGEMKSGGTKEEPGVLNSIYNFLFK